jgi:hypothetical protein
MIDACGQFLVRAANLTAAALLFLICLPALLYGFMFALAFLSSFDRPAFFATAYLFGFVMVCVVLGATLVRLAVRNEITRASVASGFISCVLTAGVFADMAARGTDVLGR